MATTKPQTVKSAAPTKTAALTKLVVPAKTVATGKLAKAGVAAASTATVTGLPAGFVSPFRRVEMQPGVRIDDGLCCIAMLTNRPLDEIMKAAFDNGLAKEGPAWMYSSALVAILRQYGIKAEEKECPTLAALPDVAMITADFDPATQFGRWALPAFNYVHDPALWLDERLKTTTEVQRLITPKSPIFYLECTPAPTLKDKGAAK